MTLEEVEAALDDSYSGRREGELLLLKDAENESEFVVERFSGSFQIRQGVWHACHELGDTELERVYRLCSAMNERFSGCKSYVDQWGTLLTAGDILADCANPKNLVTMLGQVEFVSLAMLKLSDIIINGSRMVTEQEIDEALQSPILH